VEEKLQTEPAIRIKTSSEHKTPKNTENRDKKNYLHMRNNTTQLEEQAFKLGNHKTSNDLSLDIGSLGVKKKTPDKAIPLSEKALQEIKVGRLNDLDRMVSALIKNDVRQSFN
jgi:hypothetical protein